MITASQGITPRKLGADADPHAWQSVPNAKIYVANIRDALVAADPPRAGIVLGDRAARFGQQLADDLLLKLGKRGLDFVNCLHDAAERFRVKARYRHHLQSSGKIPDGPGP